MPVKRKFIRRAAPPLDVLLTTSSRPPDMPHIAEDFKALEALLLQAPLPGDPARGLRSQARLSPGASSVKALVEGDKSGPASASNLKGKLGFHRRDPGQVRLQARVHRKRKRQSPPAATGTPGTAVATPETHRWYRRPRQVAFARLRRKHPGGRTAPRFLCAAVRVARAASGAHRTRADRSRAADRASARASAASEDGEEGRDLRRREPRVGGRSRVGGRPAAASARLTRGRRSAEVDLRRSRHLRSLSYR